MLKKLLAKLLLIKADLKIYNNSSKINYKPLENLLIAVLLYVNLILIDSFQPISYNLYYQYSSSHYIFYLYTLFKFILLHK